MFFVMLMIAVGMLGAWHMFNLCQETCDIKAFFFGLVGAAWAAGCLISAVINVPK